MCLLQTGAEVRRRRAGGKVAVRVGPRGQGDDAGLEASALEALGKEARSFLAGLVGILVKGDVDATAGLIRELGPLRGCQVSADGAGGVAKAGLPEHG